MVRSRRWVRAEELKGRLRACWMACERPDEVRMRLLGESDVLALADEVFELLLPEECERAAAECERRA